MGRLLTRLEAAERLGMSETFVKVEVRQGRVPVVRLGRMVRIDEDDLEKYITAHKSVVRIVGTSCSLAGSGADGMPNQVIEKTVVDR